MFYNIIYEKYDPFDFIAKLSSYNAALCVIK